MSENSCPSEELLEAFNEGRVDEAMMKQIGDHLDGCESCIDRLENLQPGPIAKGLRVSVLESEKVEDQLESSGSNFATSGWPNIIPSSHENLGFERYELIGCLAEKPFANLFMALDQDQQRVAIKIPCRAKITTSHHCQLFLHDATAASSLNHPHILPLLDIGFWQEDLPFAAARHLDIPNLKQFAINSTLAADEMRQVLLQICQAVGYAHDQEILHRHLTPNNIFLKPGPEVLVADFCVHYDGRYHFGLQEPLHDPNPFESPEAVKNDSEFIDHRNDIFAIGKILKLLLRITNDIDDSSRDEFESIQAQCTRQRRRDRYQTVRQIIDDINAS